MFKVGEINFNGIMGLFGKDRDHISASEVKKILLAESPPPYNKKLIDEGNRQHARILSSIEDQVNPTLFSSPNPEVKLDISNGEFMCKKGTLDIAVSDDLQLRVKPDAVVRDKTRLTCVEIKSNFRPVDLLQLMYGCIVANETYAGGNGGAIQGVLVLYARGDEVRTLKNGGREYWEQGLEIASLASEIRARTESSPLYIADLAVTNYKERAIIYRNRMNSVWEDVSRGLINSLSS